MRSGDKGHIKFRFLTAAEYIKPGQCFVFREDNCKGIGVVSGVQLEQAIQADE